MNAVSASGKISLFKEGKGYLISKRYRNKVDRAGFIRFCTSKYKIKEGYYFKVIPYINSEN